MQFDGSLLRDGQVILDDIAGNLWDHQAPTGRRFWSGEFVVPAGHPLPLGGGYRLVLTDGRAADITVTYVSRSGQAADVGKFIVSGPLR
jgi:hypothetical protein